MKEKIKNISLKSILKGAICVFAVIWILLLSLVCFNSCESKNEEKTYQPILLKNDNIEIDKHLAPLEDTQFVNGYYVSENIIPICNIYNDTNHYSFELVMNFYSNLDIRFNEPVYDTNSVRLSSWYCIYHIRYYDYLDNIYKYVNLENGFSSFTKYEYNMTITNTSQNYVSSYSNNQAFSFKILSISSLVDNLYNLDISLTNLTYFTISNNNISNVGAFAPKIAIFEQFINDTYNNSNYTILISKCENYVGLRIKGFIQNFEFGYSNGYFNGVESWSDQEGQTYEEGYYNGLIDGTEQGREIGYQEGMNEWQQNAEKTDNVIERIFGIITVAINSCMSVLSFQILPGIPLYICFLIPIVFGLLVWFIKLSAS